MGEVHPCGALPITHMSLDVWYCHHHQAFFGSRVVSTQTVDDALIGHMSDSITFGPFDSFTDLRAWVTSMTHVLAVLPDAPEILGALWRHPPQRDDAPGVAEGTEAEGVGAPGASTHTGSVPHLSSNPASTRMRWIGPA